MNTVFNLITEPFIYPFMQRALMIAVVTGMVCALLSCYLVLKGWSLMGDAISHAVLPGIVLAFLSGIPLSIGAFASGIFCAFATGYIKENSRVKQDTVMGIVFSGMFALGLVLFSTVDTDQHLSHILFGHILGVSISEFHQTLWISGVTFFVMLLKRKDFMLYCFDNNHAKVIGLPVTLLHYGLLCLLSLTIVASFQAVGVILVIAMLIAPGMTALMLCQQFHQMLIIASLVSVISCVSGILLSFHIDGATGPCIVIVQAVIFMTSLIYKQINGIKK
ncbi:iron chelate uptake ABC transporter family permease subunit [Candidatus Hamiltonella defensa]|uniref:Iron ABC transporter permease n=1 Tax=Candidatus Williamhamiltonella defendens TaxID=138072 RepID=A0AAC9VLW2_9ENTR|nr:metal ABC transporter permease [Candidatus Hamiltonella defensa]ASV34186.1 iron ABC transporter permease [Candidatus Hamiltonella defensa]AWK17144.1 iron ABC transporter permease [Candidatus Hamiltonella defensa]MBK4361001.1 iron chelate uptake ABC transporter family permease subunit [Candidatus Hamiltonella defensa]